MPIVGGVVMMDKKFVCVMLLALIAFSMLQTIASTGHHKHHRRNRYGNGSLKPYQCTGQCLRRCSQTSHHKPCMFFCQKCCKTCLCVPPGYSGHKDLCPCYNNWKTQEGRPKCP